MVETQVVSMNLLIKKVFLIHLVSSMSQRTQTMDVLQLTSAKTAPGLLAQWAKTAKISVGLQTTKNITLLTIILFLVQQK